MNKKLIKSIVSITCGLGVVAIPFAASGCSSSKKESTELVCDTDTISGNIVGNINTQITSTASLSSHIKTDTGKSVSGVTFSCDGLTEETGLTINQTTGVISGTLTKKPANPEFKIKFIANVDGKSLEGYSNTFTITVNATKLIFYSDAIKNIAINKGEDVSSTDLRGKIKTDTDELVNNVSFKLANESAKPDWLSFDSSTGVISGTAPSQAPYNNWTSIQIIAKATIDGEQLEGTSSEFSISIVPKDIVVPVIDNLSVHKGDSISTTDLSQIKTDLGQDVDNLTFTLVNPSTLPEGFSFNPSSGVIFGTAPSQKVSINDIQIKATATVSGLELEGVSNQFNINVVPASLSINTTVSSIEVINNNSIANSPNLSTVIKTDLGDNVSGATFKIKDNKTLPNGLSLNTTTGVISGTPNLSSKYSGTYQIEADATVDGLNLVGYSNEFTITVNYPFPESVYDIDDNNVLQRFKTDVDLSQYDGICDTMQIPARVTSIANNAFCKSTSSSSIPAFITKLIFTENSKCTLIGESAFKRSPITFAIFPSALTTIGIDAFFESNLSSADLLNCRNLTTLSQGAFSRTTTLKSITLPKSLTSIGGYVFENSESLNEIKWDLPRNYSSIIKVGSRSFYGISSSGTIESLDTSITSSRQLLDWLKKECNFPRTGWIAV